MSVSIFLETFDLLFVRFVSPPDPRDSFSSPLSNTEGFSVHTKLVVVHPEPRYVIRIMKPSDVSNDRVAWNP